MTTASNIAFTLLIKVNGRLKEFNFRKRSDTNYDADTNDENSSRHIFKMEKTGSAWKIKGNALPAWLIANEELISEALEIRG